MVPGVRGVDPPSAASRASLGILAWNLLSDSWERAGNDARRADVSERSIPGSYIYNDAPNGVDVESLIIPFH